MSVQAAIVRQWANELAARAAARAVRQLAKMPANLSGDDSGLRSVWEEFCVQVKGEQSFDWDLYECTVKEVVSGTLLSLSHLQQVALWLQSDAADDWLSEHEEGSELPGVFEPDVVEVVYQAVWRLADESKNPRVVRYLARAGGDDECLF
jgi:hypothetical protein